MNCVVFSRDRAMQLDAFLESVDLYVAGLFETVSVLYKPTSESFEKAYSRLAAERPGVHWVRETSFRENLQALVGKADNTVFHTDDDVYFGTPDRFDLRDDEVCFTLRLGLNTTYSYTLDLEERLIGADVVGNRVVWDWRSQGAGSYSYPLAVNGHVFRTEDVVDWLARASFSNPNDLEAALQLFNTELRPKMASFQHSTVVSIPANIVNETYANRHGDLFTPEALNDRFLLGERIDLDSMDFSSIAACHQEIPFAFRRGPRRRQAT
jgi:hypothetical protein